MGYLKKISPEEPDIVIESRCARADDATKFGSAELTREDVLAGALGRLAVLQDLEEAAARNAVECLSSASMQGTMTELEPT